MCLVHKRLRRPIEEVQPHSGIDDRHARRQRIERRPGSRGFLASIGQLDLQFQCTLEMRQQHLQQAAFLLVELPLSLGAKQGDRRRALDAQHSTDHVAAPTKAREIVVILARQEVFVRNKGLAEPRASDME